MGAKTKLLNNFLTLGNAALINHMTRAAKKFELDLQKFFDVAKLGSANSPGLTRVFDALLVGDYKGFKFTVTNTKRFNLYSRFVKKFSRG